MKVRSKRPTTSWVIWSAWCSSRLIESTMVRRATGPARSRSWSSRAASKLSLATAVKRSKNSGRAEGDAAAGLVARGVGGEDTARSAGSRARTPVERDRRACRASSNARSGRDQHGTVPRAPRPSGPPARAPSVSYTCCHRHRPPPRVRHRAGPWPCAPARDAAWDVSHVAAHDHVHRPRCPEPEPPLGAAWVLAGDQPGSEPPRLHGAHQPTRRDTPFDPAVRGAGGSLPVSRDHRLDPGSSSRARTAQRSPQAREPIGVGGVRAVHGRPGCGDSCRGSTDGIDQGAVEVEQDGGEHRHGDDVAGPRPGGNGRARDRPGPKRMRPVSRTDPAPGCAARGRTRASAVVRFGRG